MARLPPSRHPLHCGLRIPDLRARDDSPLRGSCHPALPAICLTRRLPAQRIRRCGLNATFRTRLQQCDGDWSPLSPRCYRVAHAARLGTDTEICDTVRLGNLTNAVTCAGFARLRSPLPNSIYLHMLQRTLPAGFIAPCLPTKTDELPSGAPSLTFTLLARQLHQMPRFVDEE